MIRPALDRFTRAYIECALWSSTDEHGEPLDAVFSVDDLAPETLAGIIADCADFQSANVDDLEAGPSYDRAGHDFWLTRNRHGAGFWDGNWPEPQASRLTANAKAYGSCDLYAGDDGWIYAS